MEPKPQAMQLRGWQTLSSSKILPQPSLKLNQGLYHHVLVNWPVYARIFFQLEKPGSTGSVHIFNQHGSRVKTLVNNSLLSITGSFQWDGTNLKGLPVPMGVLHNLVSIHFIRWHYWQVSGNCSGSLGILINKYIIYKRKD